MWLTWSETIKKGEGRGEDDLRKLQSGRAEEQNQYEQFSTPLNEVLSFKGWIVKCSWRTTRNQDKHGVRRRANLKRINFTKHICSREILIRIALDCQVTSSRAVIARGHVPKQDERVVSDCHEPSARVPYWSGKSGSLIFLHENTAICGERIRRIKAFPVCYGCRGGSCETFVSPTVVTRNWIGKTRRAVLTRQSYLNAHGWRRGLQDATSSTDCGASYLVFPRRGVCFISSINLLDSSESAVSHHFQSIAHLHG